MESMMMQVQRELGSITESLRQGETHRRDVIERLDKHTEKMETMSGQMNNLSQAVTSQSTLLQPLLLEKCGERLTAIEATLVDYATVKSELQFWNRVMGGGMRGISKLVLAIVSSGGVGAGAVEVIHHFWP